MTRRGSIRIGISGWTYKPWRGIFYPKGLRQKDELAYAGPDPSATGATSTSYSGVLVMI